MNQIINSSNQVSRTIKFVYAVKDDLFVDQESRVKCFDFIIPIIPVMDYKNSYQHLCDAVVRIGGQNLFKVLNEKLLLRDVSRYIRDKRLLSNILNEYYIYLVKDMGSIDYKKPERLKKIFALVVYKNFMPEDFSKIKEKKSILCKIIEEYRNKTLFLKIKAKWENSIAEKQKELKQLELVKDQSIDNLKTEFIDSLLFPSNHKLNISQRQREYNYRYDAFTKEKKLPFLISI